MTKDRAQGLATRACARFAAHYGGECRVALAPGRANLIGEHTDYNDGFVLPFALDRSVAVAYRPRADRRIVAVSSLVADACEAAVDDLAAVSRRGWFAYVAGVAAVLGDAGWALDGADLAIESDLPSGAGLSSSAALEVACARAFADMAEREWDPLGAARACRLAENSFVGVPCGIMDQMAAAASRAGDAMLLDCRSLSIEYVAIPAAIALVIMDTGVRRRVAASEYAARRAACELAATVLRSRDSGVFALRDVDAATLAAAEPLMDPVTWRRARHVVDENARVLSFAAALRRNDFHSAGELLNASHESLRTLFEVSSEELDRVVALARAQPGCFGARMTGAGFGGCAIAMISRADAPAFIEAVASAYGAHHRDGAFFVAEPSAGARIVG